MHELLFDVALNNKKFMSDMYEKQKYLPCYYMWKQTHSERRCSSVTCNMSFHSQLASDFMRQLLFQSSKDTFFNQFNIHMYTHTHTQIREKSRVMGK